MSILSEEIKSQFEYYDFRDKVIRTEELPVSLAIKGEYVTNYELKLIHKKTGAESYYLCSTSPLHIDHTDSQYNILTMMDVSAENRDEKNRRDFIQIAAHELRTPLTSIKGFTQLVLERYREREMKWFFQPTLKLMQEIDRDQTFFKVILDEAIRLDELTNELLSIFKMDQGKFDMNLQVYDISLIAEEALDEFIIPNEFHHIQYTNHLSEAYVYADVKQIKRVIHNLISNAVKYAPHHPNICIVLDQHQGAIRFSVQDQGIGIPEEQQARLFERFFRAHTDEHEGIHGFGVGLHICQEIMRQHGGQISFTSKYGEGSTFYFELPIYPVSNLT
ncbi:sensor histidine kinase [Caldalkalibacillus mannanilyticus]|uniref:sensor histidine kinase n=1 Tax=Caldalkalibacillus mannanilyticus TaxID=1418 RepID=UPI00046974B1|nr:HAMP domain-containing sensor histidine kinase [Caldalkalibacillus mannanilyticus]